MAHFSSLPYTALPSHGAGAWHYVHGDMAANVAMGDFGAHFDGIQGADVGVDYRSD